MTQRSTATRLGLVLLLSTTFSASARAIDLSIGSPTNNTSFSFSGDGGNRNAASSVSITNGGGTAANSLGSTLTGQVRYISNTAADTPIFESASATTNSNYNFSFSVTAPSSVYYTVAIDTRLTGGLTAVDDTGVSSGGTANVSNVSGALNSVGNASLGLSTAASQGGTGSEAMTNVNATSSLNLGVFNTNTTNNLQFSWQTFASSPNNILGGDEHASRFGLNDVLGGADADNYPGNPGRDISQDGHFATITVTVLNTQPFSVPSSNFFFSAASPSLVLSDASFDNDPGQTLSYEWKAGSTVIATTANPTVNVFTTPGFTITAPGQSQAGSLKVTDSPTFFLTDEQPTTFSYANTFPSMTAVSATTNYTTNEVTFAGLFDDLDLVGNGFISSFEDITYEFDLTAPGSAGQVGVGGFINGASTPTQTTGGTVNQTYSLPQLLGIFGALGTYTVYASIADSSGVFLTVPVEVNVVPEPGSLLIWSGLGAAVGLTAWRRRRQTKV